MKCYKATDMNMRCRGLQYKIGEKQTADGDLKICTNGLHACTDPIDLFSYYAPSESRFFEAKAEGVSEEKSDDSKIVARSITLIREIGFDEIVDEHISEVRKKCASERTGYRVVASATGDHGVASATGGDGVSMACGYRGKAKASKGNAIFLAERDVEWNIVSVCAVIVDGEKIKENVYYTIKNGELVETE